MLQWTTMSPVIIQQNKNILIKQTHKYNTHTALGLTFEFFSLNEPDGLGRLRSASTLAHYLDLEGHSVLAATMTQH